MQSKRGAAITTLHIDSELSQHELQQDLGVLAQQALPLELRWVFLEFGLFFKIMSYSQAVEWYRAASDAKS